MATRKTYSQMLDDIELLRKQAEEQRRKEVEVVVARIRDAIAFWGLTAEDLGFGAKAPRTPSPTPPPPAPAKKKKRKSRYTERPLAGPKGARG